jgi:cellobiose PTS system EIIC component
LSEQRHLRAIRDGVISSLPFIIIGSIFLIIAFPPFPADSAISKWAAEHVAQILIPYRVTFYIMSLYIAFGVGYNLSKSYKMDPLSGGQIAVASLLLTIIPQNIKEVGFVLPMQNLGGHGLFVTMLVSILSVEIARFCKEKKITIKMPEQVPPSVARSFEALIPVGLVVGIMTIITVVFEIDLHSLVDKAVSPFIQAGDTLPSILILVFLITFFWAFGIHGVSVVGTIARPVWEIYLAKNADAVTTGAKTLPYVSPEPFYQWFIWIGGSGATLGLVLAMIVFAKSNYLKALSRASIVPGIFNINEPVIFGLPIVLNPIMVIPFIIVPLITSTLSYVATVTGFVHPTYILAPWTLPAPIGAFFATGGDWNAVILVFVNILISFFIYLPFLRVYDRNLIAQETQAEKTA